MASKKQGHFWELEAWMAENGVDTRGLAIMLKRSKSVISRLLCGQFMRWDEGLKADIVELTKREVGPDAFAEFERRRLDERRTVLRTITERARAVA